MTSAARRNALVLRAFDFAETSQILHLLTREEGRVHGIAKGARRLKGAFHGGVDALHLGEALVYPRRPSADLRTLGSFATTTHFPRLRESLGRFNVASHVLALLLAFTKEEEAVPLVFDLSIATLGLLEETNDEEAQALGLAFEAKLLLHAGFFPELTRCVACGKPARNVTTTRLSPLRGGLLCRDCVAEHADAPRVTGEVVAALRHLVEASLPEAAALASDPELRRGLRDALDAVTSTVLDRRLATARLV